ncbi:hypothetical protein SAMN02910384_02164 [Pseudobutyrivibrio sp. ACV-2]|uniref:hypothetical protein n=1 Tax=Pseudobutyrivibrio sp. ACV-2 TaxID=1520801 RepID=UPI00089D1313|nr:hypothetical protein [Pseudobutyrivibrio sp. ACV-2]SEA72273.1 hypothetical protein SAMN02910384_02164 [Pseudobutyrivibrio sp. ACV-2]
MTKFNGVVIENAEMAQEFIDKFEMRKKRWMIAFAASIVSLIFSLKFSRITPGVYANLPIIFGITSTIIILIMGLDKMIYFLSLIKNAWIRGWEQGGDGFVFSFLSAYLYAGFVVSFLCAFYYVFPFSGILISGVFLLRAYRGCQEIIQMEG